MPISLLLQTAACTCDEMLCGEPGPKTVSLNLFMNRNGHGAIEMITGAHGFAVPTRLDRMRATSVDSRPARNSDLIVPDRSLLSERR
ncbi:hypothetical protein RB12295 [Rhodopirellula baltica SH 1]|uniref:Uncharacterized protein n=1 Tax=Rhodopirellula baltica (strain DSM 10527 / NCIMB 13988 / SH1) TaxID=243090 RepID=Q7UIW0_RHOBA|nr:hypothetical protein RB12295 [Rhodopirellula baltica SH 1]